jgi:hypothetical protein
VRKEEENAGKNACDAFEVKWEADDFSAENQRLAFLIAASLTQCTKCV